MNALLNPTDVLVETASFSPPPTTSSDTPVALQKPRALIDLASQGWLVSGRFHCTTMRVTDAQRSDQVSRDAHATVRGVDVVHILLPNCPEFRAVLNHRQTVDNFMKRLTLPWNGPLRYLLHFRLAEFDEGWAKLKEVETSLLNALEKVYDDAVRDAAFTRGDLFKKEHYPPFAELRRRFHSTLYRTEVPTGDYRVKISQEQAEDLYKHYTREVESIVENMQSKISQEMVTVMESLSKSCDETIVIQPDGTRKVKRNKLVESTFKKALTLCDTILHCNPTGNPALEEARNGLVAALTSPTGETLTIETLRESGALRNSVKSQVDDVLAKFKPVAPLTTDEEDF